jgi:predicted DNA-binding mobile mystery protein A
MNKRRLQIDQLERKITPILPLQLLTTPPTGWIKAIRSALGMTLQQLGNRLGITKQAVQDIELREREGSITLKALRETAQALDMRLVYGFIPKDGTLEALIERRARELATQIVLRTSNTMKLENQENSKERIEQAIKERTAHIIQEMPRILWDQK